MLQAPGRQLFDTLFTDPRHLRGDIRMVRTAIRQNRIAPEHRDALVRRMTEAFEQSRATWQERDRSHVRVMLAFVHVWMDMNQQNFRTALLVGGYLDDEAVGTPDRRVRAAPLSRREAAERDARARAAACSPAGGAPYEPHDPALEGKLVLSPGRPRTRPRVSQFPAVLTGDRLVEHARAIGGVSRRREVLPVAVTASGGGAPTFTQSIQYECIRGAGGAVLRTWPICPRCHRRRKALYPITRQFLCRVCARIAGT